VSGEREAEETMKCRFRTIVRRLGHSGARLVLALLTAYCSLLTAPAYAERIKDLASVQGVRHNQLIGYGLVVGLDGSGDQTTQTPFTVQSIVNMLSNLGVTLPPGTSLQLKNVAAVMVTASLPPFARAGQQIDITVSSMGNAKSLRGGTLLMAPLKGADGNVYAIAQGNVLVGGAGASAGGSKVQINHLSVGRISGGATVERAVPTALGEGEFVHLELNATDFGTVQRAVEAINRNLGDVARAVDGRRIRVRAPADVDSRVSFLGSLENIDLAPAPTAAKVIVNGRTGSVVMNRTVAIDTCAVAHGGLSVTVSAEQQVSQPAPLSGGQTTVTERADIQIAQQGGSLLTLKAGVSLAEVVKALNAIGASPLDLIAILQAMKAAGALRAELEII
jgi:flagellar P-ring protein precursor FlgI